MTTNHRFAHYVVAYATTLVFLGVGAITSLGIDWYQTLVLPAWMPSTMVVAGVWGILFICTSLSAGMVWDKERHDARARTAITLYAANALLVLLWNYVFFGLHLLMEAAIVAGVVGLTVIALIMVVRRISPKAAWLLAPYFVWMVLALYLNHLIWALN